MRRTAMFHWTFLFRNVRFTGFFAGVAGSGLPPEERMWQMLERLPVPSSEAASGAVAAAAADRDLSLQPRQHIGESARRVAPFAVPRDDDAAACGWREFRIGSFLHPPVHLRPLDALWSRPPVESGADSGSQQTAADAACQTTPLAHFLEFTGVELRGALAAEDTG